ncbi:MAG: monovalent cation/H+ antiporter subunit D [Steroidobacteraceae bacterium]|jgi:multicomponent K+:H+ antiporter subunit D|nr:monovalent cation/H+ antiporter subunit D [Steroidobacteraceae bacterium]
MSPSSLAAQLPMLPVVVPLLAGALLLALGRRGGPLAGTLSLTVLLAVLACAVALATRTADGTVLAYLAGNWPAPFGIALAVDRFSATMLVVAALVAIACQLAAVDDLAARQPAFPALLQFQLAGLNGAFLTADLFNLFVFFEVLLVASYALLVSTVGRDSVRAGVHYVAVNLFASALFLMAAALLYGVLGTLNMADLASRTAAVPGADRPLVEAAGLMLLVAFGIKAAALPLGTWLPSTYAAAPPPVAALFAIMTKVGLYAIARVGTLVYGDGSYQHVLGPLLVAIGLGTLAFAALAGLAARDLRTLAAWMIAGSAGTVLLLVGVGTPRSLGAAMFYLPHATFAAAALMLVAGLLATARGPEFADRFEAGPRPAAAALLGTLFVVCALASAGLPPFSGFVAKAILLDSVRGEGVTAAAWLVVLGASLAWVVALSRAGSRLFWKSQDAGRAAVGGGVASAGAGALSAIALLVAAGATIVVLAGPLARHFAAAGSQLAASGAYRDAVLRQQPVRRPAAPVPAGSMPERSR